VTPDANLAQQSNFFLRYIPHGCVLLQRCHTPEHAVPAIEAFADANPIHRHAWFALALPFGCCFVQSQHEVKVSCSQFAGRVEPIPETAELLSEVTQDCWAPGRVRAGSRSRKAIAPDL
jgi:hypothetical protein